MRDPMTVDGNLSLRDQGYGSGKEDPFRFFHHTSLKDLGCIAFFDLYRFLQKDRSVIEIFIHEMDGSAGDLDASLKDSLMHMQSVIPFPAERGDQRGMHIDDPSPVFVDHAGRYSDHKPRQYDQVRLGFTQRSKKRLIKELPVLIIFGRYAYAFYSGGFGPFKRIGAGVVADDTDNPGIDDPAAL